MIKEDSIFIEVKLPARVHDAMRDIAQTLSEIADAPHVSVEQLAAQICEREVCGCKCDCPDGLPSEPVEGGTE